MTRVPWLTLVLVVDAGGLSGDEIHLTDGRVIEGEVVSPAGAEVLDVRVGSGSLVAIQHFPRSKVDRVVYGVSARQTALGDLHRQVESLAKRSDAGASDWWSLARRFQERGEAASARELAGRVGALDS